MSTGACYNMDGLENVTLGKKLDTIDHIFIILLIRISRRGRISELEIGLMIAND